MQKNQIYPYVAVLIGVISVSTAAVLVKLATDAPAAIIANYRLLLAVLIMLPFILLKKRVELTRLTKRDWIFTSLAGISLALHFIFWFESLNYTSVASSVVLVTLQPIFAFIGTYLFFKERFSAGAVISMIIAIFGSTIIAWGDFRVDEEALFGDILAIIGAVMITIYFLFGQTVRKTMSVMSYTFVVYGIGALTLLVYNLIIQNEFTGYDSDHWLIFLALAIIPTFFGHTLFNWAIRWVSTSIISMGIIFEPVGASILAYFILGEQISWSQWLGGTIVIFGLFLFIASTRRKRKMKLTISS
ncbi:DMT family transporter [Saliterribacillus persicus]|uniref:Threonine/homoserine efflux transporter RhtA n=1 Tax=Saliterribacillus persicus TaxID=930114 RepID=A0A368Y015_9BACI|nr:DMT family transporter [Saliterribacillus persicus]RCW73039.1 threonine/homoserine efflux transporter RhtA [Saliterribacillus persicus]